MTTRPNGAAHQPSSVTLTLPSNCAGVPSNAAAAATPKANNSSWTVPYISRDDPATMAPAANSDSPVTIRAPGSSTASGGSTVRNAPSSRPASAAAKTRADTAKAATVGSSASSDGCNSRRPGQPDHDGATQRCRAEVRQARLQDEADPHGHRHEPALGQPRRVAQRLATQFPQPVEGLVDIDPAADEQVSDEPDVGGLVESQPPVDRLEGGRITAGQTDVHAGRPRGDLHVGHTEVATHLPQLVLDLVDRLARGDHRRTEERQQPAAAAVAVPTTGARIGHDR